MPPVAPRPRRARRNAAMLGGAAVLAAFSALALVLLPQAAQGRVCDAVDATEWSSKAVNNPHPCQCEHAALSDNARYRRQHHRRAVDTSGVDVAKTDKCFFIAFGHVPKTGGTSMRDFLKKAGAQVGATYVYRYASTVLSPHANASRARVSGKANEPMLWGGYEYTVDPCPTDLGCLYYGAKQKHCLCNHWRKFLPGVDKKVSSASSVSELPETMRRVIIELHQPLLADPQGKGDMKARPFGKSLRSLLAKYRALGCETHVLAAVRDPCTYYPSAYGEYNQVHFKPSLKDFDWNSTRSRQMRTLGGWAVTEPAIQTGFMLGLSFGVRDPELEAKMQEKIQRCIEAGGESSRTGDAGCERAYLMDGSYEADVDAAVQERGVTVAAVEAFAESWLDTIAPMECMDYFAARAAQAMGLFDAGKEDALAALHHVPHSNGGTKKQEGVEHPESVHAEDRSIVERVKGADEALYQYALAQAEAHAKDIEGRELMRRYCAAARPATVV